MIHTSPISSRNQFGSLLNSLGLVGRAAEIGTHRGQFAVLFMACWEGESLLCVDHWSIPSGYEDQAETLPEKGRTRSEDKGETLRSLEPYMDRVEIFHGSSEAASRDVSDDSLDFVYIDGDHSLEGFRHDVELWWPKLKPGGMMACHDFICPGERDGGWGKNIQPVFTQHALLLGLDVYTVVEENGLPWSAYIIKPE